MHFRVRGNVVQIIRIKYDSSTKKAKNTIIGTLQKNRPEITESLQAQCTPEELNEIREWIGSTQTLSDLKAEYAARTLGQQIDLSIKWFSTTESDGLHSVAAEILPQLVTLRKVFKTRGLL